MGLPKPLRRRLDEAAANKPGFATMLRGVAVAQRVIQSIFGLFLLLASTWTVGAGLVTGRMQLGTRSGIRGGALIVDWLRSPIEFALTAALLLALAAFGFFLVVRSICRRPAP